MRRHPCGLWHRLYEWLRVFLGQTFLETFWLQAVVILFPSVFDGSCLASWIRLIGSLPHHRNNLCPFDVVAKRFVAWWERSTVALLDCSQGIFLITTAHAYEGFVPCFVYVWRGKAVNRADKWCDTWHVNFNGRERSYSGHVSVGYICHEPLEWLQLPLSKEALCEVTAAAGNACIPSSASVIPACFSFRMAAIFDTTMYRRWFPEP